jgi:thioredoxin-like negative regulator of GroEL
VESTEAFPGWRPSTPDVQGRAIDELRRHHPAIAIHFWASWNRVDREMDRSIQEMTSRFADRVWFASCDVDRPENVELCQRFGVSNIPALGVLVADRPLKLLMGFHERHKLAAELEYLLDPPMPESW